VIAEAERQRLIAGIGYRRHHVQRRARQPERHRQREGEGEYGAGGVIVAQAEQGEVVF